jgi:hypothetical protein
MSFINYCVATCILIVCGIKTLKEKNVKGAINKHMIMVTNIDNNTQNIRYYSEVQFLSQSSKLFQGKKT